MTNASVEDGSQRESVFPCRFPVGTYLVPMRTAARSALVLVSLLLTACGQVEPVLLAVSMPDCTYRGATQMEPGEASLSLSLNGLGSARALLVELEDGRTYVELGAHLEQAGGWGDRPDWIRPVIDLGLSDVDGVDGREASSRLAAGDYAVVCIDLETGTARAASPLRVEGR